MAKLPLTKEMILNSAEEVLLRFGPAKANVQDVARALNVSHPVIYRHYDSKAKLWDAVVERWLERAATPLNDILNEPLSPDIKLYRWLEASLKGKRQSAINEPELFAIYTTLAAQSREVLHQHVTHLIEEIIKIIKQGVDEGVFVKDNPKQTALAILNAFTRFYHPAHVNEWQNPNIDKEFNALWEILLKGITYH